MIIKNQNHQIIICGDFNVHVQNQQDRFAQEFLELFESSGFHQLVKFPTHIAGGTLDLVFTRETSQVIDIKEDSDLLFSDHFLIEISLSINLSTYIKKSQHYCRKVSAIDLNMFQKDLSERIKSLSTKSEPANHDLKIKEVFKSIETTLDSHAPKRLIHTSKSTKIFTNTEIRQVRRKKRRAERKYRKSRLKCDKETLKLASELVVKTVKKEYNLFYSKKLNAAKNDIKATYKVINALLNKQQ